MSQNNYWTRSMRRRISRRRALGTAATFATGASALALVGCGDDDDDDETGTPDAGNGDGNGGGAGGDLGDVARLPEGKSYSDLTLEEARSIFNGGRLKNLPGQELGPTPGGTLYLGGQPPVSWDITGPAAALLASYMLANNQLIQFKMSDFVDNPNFTELEAGLAESMPEQPDDTTFTFTLREGVRFQNVAPVDGREMTSEDVVYSMEAMRTAPAQAPTFEHVDRIEALDATTVQFTMTQPTAYFVNTIGLPFHWVFAREQHESPEGLATRPIGTGAYILESQEPLSGYRFVKNPDHYAVDQRTGMQLPYLDAIESTYFGSTAQSISAFRSGQVDQLAPQSRDAWLNVLDSNPDAITQVTTPAPSYQPYYAMRLDKEPFNNPDVRRALSLLIDRRALIDQLHEGMAGYGYGQDWTYFGNEWPFTEEELGNWNRYDPDEAQRLLDAAGVDGLELDVLYFTTQGSYFDAYNAVSAMWDAGGVRTNITASQDPALFQSQFYGRTYNHVAAAGVLGPAWDPDGFAYHAMHSQSTRNYFFIDDPHVDELAARQRTQLVRDEREATLRELMEYDLDQVTRLWLVAPYRFAMRKPNIFNLLDVEAGWIPGWGSQGLDRTWKYQA